MDSPNEPDSPISRSSESPPPEDLVSETQAVQDLSFLRDNASNNGKRRFTGGPSSGPSFSAKNRRREEGPARRSTNINAWQAEGIPRLQKDDLVDISLVERIRAGMTYTPLHSEHLVMKDVCVDWGDPFDNSDVINKS